VIVKKAINREHLEQLKPLESQLKQETKRGDIEAAANTMKAIIKLLSPYGNNHHRLLESKLWYFECQRCTLAAISQRLFVRRFNTGR
jgi:hypothetical protein